MQSNVLLSNHIMIGWEMHDTLVTPIPPTPVPSPHYSFGVLGFGLPATVHQTKRVMCHGVFVMQRGTDIGLGIPHFPLVPNLLLPLIILASGSKSEFGVLNVLVENMPVASAVLSILNLNLNCYGPSPPFMVPLPTGFVPAINTVIVDMNLNSFVACFCVMVIDASIQGLINMAGSAIGNAVSPASLFGYYALNLGIWAGTDAFLGSPLGFSSSHEGMDNPLTGERSMLSSSYRTPTGGLLTDWENAQLRRDGATNIDGAGESLEDYYNVTPI